jgi:hypothetical protein
VSRPDTKKDELEDLGHKNSMRTYDPESWQAGYNKGYRRGYRRKIRHYGYFFLDDGGRLAYMSARGSKLNEMKAADQTTKTIEALITAAKKETLEEAQLTLELWYQTSKHHRIRKEKKEWP